MDRAAILALNNAHAAETSFLTPERLDAMIAAAFHIGVMDEGRSAFLLAFDRDADYDSPNFLWFRSRFTRFAYVDRIVTAASARGQGHARALYTDLFRAAVDHGLERVGCEVNLVPPNPGSDAFHSAMNFVEIGRGSPDGVKQVRYMSRRLPTP